MVKRKKIENYNNIEEPLKKRLITKKTNGLIPSSDPHLIIMIPGVGKSTYLKNHPDLLKNTVLINRDSIIEDEKFLKLNKNEKQKWIIAHQFRTELKNKAIKNGYRMCFDITGSRYHKLLR